MGVGKYAEYMNSTQKRIAYFKSIGVKFLDKMPEGWKELKFTLTAPSGYVWIWNGKNPFEKKNMSEKALLKVS